MTLPTPVPGLVISYGYLWIHEYRAGQQEGVKDRPCAIVAAHRRVEGAIIVTVLPITHAPPTDSSDAIEIPSTVKRHLGLDDQRSWIIISEINEFFWPGPDIRPIPGTVPRRFSYGMLPPRFFAYIRDRLIEAHERRKLARIVRSD